MRARSPGAVERLIGGMGSHLDPEGLQYYARLLSDAGHVSGALRMMASWDLKPLERELRGLPVPLTLLAFAGDRAVPAADSVRVAALVPGAVVTTIPDLGHLAHEEDPHRVAALVREAARRAGVLCR